MADVNPIVERIAGHDFDLNARCIRETCSYPGGARMSDILSAGKDQLGKMGWAHTGSLNQTELDEIIKKRGSMWTAVHKVSAL